MAEELCRLLPKDTGINLTPVLHKSKRASRVARARGPLRRPLQQPGDRRGRPRDRGSFRGGRGDASFRCVTTARVEAGCGSASTPLHCILLYLLLPHSLHPCEHPLQSKHLHIPHSKYTLLHPLLLLYVLLSLQHLSSVCYTTGHIITNISPYVHWTSDSHHTLAIHTLSTPHLAAPG